MDGDVGVRLVAWRGCEGGAGAELYPFQPGG